ncbi:hypothetical protein C8F01DRAFT_1249863 [Mycena amicta]|nr:hypothetical protein C8F01DRAFT_1249863 [Mycena amicta]
MSVELEALVPPPTYSFNAEPESSSPAGTDDDLVSAQSHCSFGHVDLADVEQPYLSATPAPSPPTPQRRPTTSSGIPPSSQVRMSMFAFPDHKLQPVSGPRRRLSTSSSSSTNASNVTQPHPSQVLNPTNYVSVFRKTHRRTFSLSRFSASIKGTFAVNPFLDIPSQLLSPLAAGETVRKNLQLKVENGGIDVDVHLIGEPPQSGTNNSNVVVTRTELHLELCGSENVFPLLARIHTPTVRRLPFRLTLVSKNGFLSLHLPPSFHGLLRITVAAGDLNNHITLSATLAPHATILSEDSTSRAYFIGALGAGRWEGDRAQVNVDHGKVRIQFSGPGERDLDDLRRVGWDLMRF